ncbi:hypothetical protein [Pontibacter indicus]|uniref:Uncharacterized protein n=1 Tax=Pontibacter indicus TaxID=1317125 RepID=A0A1R3XM20_9BACT|nr:hypothetical protein [Pontibacter indicus]SIT92685.1 hypothetical protein SAMN05444128_2920 [Pontibacter indicus]
MHKLLVLLLAIAAFSCTNKPGSTAQSANSEQLVFDRIAYVYQLKPTIAKDIWPGFDEERYDVPLIYYTDSSSFIANPTDKFLQMYSPALVFQNSALQIYKTAARLDSTPFHMAVGFSFSDASDYDYFSPFMHCSSLEETAKVVTDVAATEVWVSMVVHEYFHGFQLQHKSYRQYFADSLGSFNKGLLKGLYKDQVWFKKQIDQENTLLLQALETDNRDEIRKLLSAFFKERENRRNETMLKHDVDIGAAEKLYETMEGTARYVEQKLYEKFSQKQPDANLQRADSAYQGYEYFKSHKLDNDKWLYLTAESGVYFYATGFNMARVLDKLGVPYKERLFKESKLSLEDILRTI